MASKKLKVKSEKPKVTKKVLVKKTKAESNTKTKKATKTAAKPAKKAVAKKAPVKKTAVAKKIDNKGASEKLAELIVHGMQELKAINIVLLDLRGIQNSVCDFFVISHGNSSTHADAIAQSVEKEVKKTTGEYPWKREGVSNGEWVLIDYVTVVVHVFQQYTRELYNIEDLWADAKSIKVKQVA